MAWRVLVDVLSVLGGLFALTAMWLYLRPQAVVTLEAYEYVPGAGSRRFRLVVRNTGNVSVRILRMNQEFQNGRPPDTWTDLSPMFTNRDLPPSGEIPVWLEEADMARRAGFTITYKGWVPRQHQNSVRFDVKHYGVVYNVSAMSAGVASATAIGEVIRHTKD